MVAAISSALFGLVITGVFVGAADSPNQDSRSERLEIDPSRSINSDLRELIGNDSSRGGVARPQQTFSQNIGERRSATSTQTVAREIPGASRALAGHAARESAVSGTYYTAVEFEPQSNVTRNRLNRDQLSTDLVDPTVDSLSGNAAFEPLLQLAAIGPVESISLTEDGSTELFILGQSFATPYSDSDVVVGDYVFAGSLDGTSLNFFVPVGEEYIQGVSEVGVIGAIDSVRPEIAQFSIGETTFDYSNILSDSPQFALVPGDYVEVAGNQTAASASILLGIHGSGSTLLGIHGSGSTLLGIHGSGSTLQGIHGSGSTLLGIHGSGSTLLGIHGSGSTLR